MMRINKILADKFMAMITSIIGKNCAESWDDAYSGH